MNLLKKVTFERRHKDEVVSSWVVCDHHPIMFQNENRLMERVLKATYKGFRRFARYEVLDVCGVFCQRSVSWHKQILVLIYLFN